jgi:dihydrofolate reductase
MTRLLLDISMSLDGFVAGPRPTLEDPLGEGGERLHDWVVKLATWRERHGLDGGETGPVADLVAESVRRTGAVIMGRRMFSGGDGPWEDDPKADGWWGDEPPFRVPVFVLTHHARRTVEKAGGTSFTFVTDGIESALRQARAAAGEKDVSVTGGAATINQFLAAGLVDEIRLHVVPQVLGHGDRVFDGVPPQQLEIVSVRAASRVTHLVYRPAGRRGSVTSS